MMQSRQIDGPRAFWLACALIAASLGRAAPIASVAGGDLLTPTTAPVATNSAVTNDLLDTVSVRKPIAVWDTDVRISIDGGYRENVLRTSVAPEQTAFSHSTAEASFIRLSEIGTQYNLFALAEDWRYPGCDSVGSEQLASATAQGLWPVGQWQEASAELQYFYQKQVLDLSETDTELRRLLVQGNSFYARPKWRFNFDPQCAVQFEGVGMRQIYAEEQVDDYWEAMVRVSVVRKYGNRSEASGYLQIANRRFDSWEQYELSGNVVTNSNLHYWRPEIGGQIRHFWDKDRLWRTVTRLSYLWNQDNGRGYFDFGRFLFYQQLRWHKGPWEIRGGAKVGWYRYDNQDVAGENRERSYVTADLRVERYFGKNFLLFAASEREWDFSNDPLDQYTDLWVSGGVGLEF